MGTDSGYTCSHTRARTRTLLVFFKWPERVKNMLELLTVYEKAQLMGKVRDGANCLGKKWSLKEKCTFSIECGFPD